MNIVYHHRTQAKGAEGVHIREIVKALEGLGNKVFVVSPPRVSLFQHEEPSNNKKIFSLISKFVPQILFEYMEISYNLFAGWKLSAILKKEKIDLIYERYAFFGFIGSILANKYNVPIILEVNEVSGLKRVRGLFLKGLARYIERIIFNRTDAIIVVSRFLKNQIELIQKENKKNIYVVPNGVNIDIFNTFDRNQKNSIDVGFPANKIVLGFIGGFVEWHRLDFLLQVLHDIIFEVGRKNILLILLGSGKLEKSLRGLVNSMKLNDYVKFAGRVEHADVPNFIKCMDICIIPHSNEFRSPIKMFEYMAMAKAVVAPRVGPIEDVIKNNYNGILFTPEEKESFKACIIDLIDNQYKRESLGIHARDTILSSYLWSKNAERIIQILNEVKYGR